MSRSKALLLTWILTATIATARSVRANPEDDIVPLDPNTPSVLEILAELWELIRQFLV